MERATRFVLLVHLPDGHSAPAVRDAMIPAISTRPEQLHRSLVSGPGTELARHRDITLATGLDSYYCDPHSPRRRGSNENNGLLRQYFPKSTDSSAHSPEELARVAGERNSRRQETLGGLTPAAAVQALLCKPRCGVRLNRPCHCRDVLAGGSRAGSGAAQPCTSRMTATSTP